MKDKGRQNIGRAHFSQHPANTARQPLLRLFPREKRLRRCRLKTHEDWLIESDVMKHLMLITMKSEWRPDGAAEHCVSLRGGLRRLWRVLLEGD